jgi:hypothetical protein
MPLEPNSKVHHSVFGPGVVRELLGGTTVVDFFGELIDVPVRELDLEADEPHELQSPPTNHDTVRFRQAYEAINLGVVPPHPDELVSLSIGGTTIAGRMQGWLQNAERSGMTKVFFGAYGSGKSHHLRMIEAAALSEGWVVGSLELDPKNADAAKPYLVYRGLVSSLRFPSRDDGTRCATFFDLIGEIRRFWTRVSQARYLKSSPWFRITLEALRRFPHTEEREYMEVCEWLAGEPVQYANVKRFCRERGGTFPPNMPRVRECAEIYAHHLVVLHYIMKSLGYKGLLVVLDEAEHVRAYNVTRRGRATNFSDFLARCAHPPLNDIADPFQNEHGFELPRFWNEGPHFGLVVGLTEGDTFSNSAIPLRDACVFLHSPGDVEKLQSPAPSLYEHWCNEFFQRCHKAFPNSTSLLAQQSDRSSLASTLAHEYKKQKANERTLRIWTKLATFVLSTSLVGKVESVGELHSVVRRAAQEASGEVLPWE